MPGMLFVLQAREHPRLREYQRRSLWLQAHLLLWSSKCSRQLSQFFFLIHPWHHHTDSCHKAFFEAVTTTIHVLSSKVKHAFSIWKDGETHRETANNLNHWTFTIPKPLEFLCQKTCLWHWKTLRCSIKVKSTMMCCSHKFRCLRLRQLMI